MKDVEKIEKLVISEVGILPFLILVSNIIGVDTFFGKICWTPKKNSFKNKDLSLVIFPKNKKNKDVKSWLGLGASLVWTRKAQNRRNFPMVPPDRFPSI